MGSKGCARPGSICGRTLISLEAMSTEAVQRGGYGSGERPQWDYYSKCIHCGLCLNACPTYRELGVEMDSPRGRIYQMIQVERGRLPLAASFVRHIDLCLDCRACETACPSGVEYGRLVEAARGQIDKYYKRPLLEASLRRLFFHQILPNRKRLAAVGWILRLYQQSGLERLILDSDLLKALPGRLANVARLAPRMEKPFLPRGWARLFLRLVRAASVWPSLPAAKPTCPSPG